MVHYVARMPDLRRNVWESNANRVAAVAVPKMRQEDSSVDTNGIFGTVR